MPKLVSIDDHRYAALTLQSLRVMFGPLQASTTSLESQESYLTAGMLPYNRNVTLQTFLSSTRDFYRLHSTFARLYDAAASPASRLRSAGSLAITNSIRIFQTNNLLLTEREGRTGEYWPEVVAVRTERSEVPTKTTEGQYSPVRLEQARLVSSLLYGIVFLGEETLPVISLKSTSGAMSVDLMTRATQK